MKNAKITKLIFVPTGAYHEMALRPYSMHVTGDLLDRLDRATDHFTNLSTGSFAGVAGSILRPTTQSAGTLSIANGWNENRFIFMMEVVHENEGYVGEDASVRVQYISGYTDHGQISYSGYLDPGMRMHLTTVITTRETRQYTRRGVSANRYLSPRSHQGTLDDNRYFAMRPRDVCVTVGNSGLYDTVAVDYRTAMSSRPLMSTVRNDLPSDYMARTFQSYQLGMQLAETHDDLPTLMNSVAANSGDEAALDDPFVLNLHRNTELSEGDSFSYGELCQLYRGVDDVVHVVPPQDMTVSNIGFSAHTPMDSQHWGGSNTETVVSTILASTVPALMTDAMITQAAFYITNDTVNGQPYMEWLSPPQSFMMSGESLEQQATYFTNRMLHEIFRDLTNNGNMTVTLTVFSDLVMSDTRMEVQVDGGDVVPFCVPNFASSMITPVIANNVSQLESMADNVNQVFDAMAPSSIQYPEDPEYTGGFNLGTESLSSALKNRQSTTPAPAAGGSWKV